MAVNCSALNPSECQNNPACYVSGYNSSTQRFICKCNPSYGNLNNNDQKCISCGAYYIPDVKISHGCNNVPVSYYGYYGLKQLTEEECKDNGGTVHKKKMLCFCGDNEVGSADGKCYHNNFNKNINCTVYDGNQILCNKNYQCAYNSALDTCGCNTGRGYYNNSISNVCELCAEGYWLNKTTSGQTTTYNCTIPSNETVVGVGKTSQINITTCIGSGLTIKNGECKCPDGKLSSGDYGCYIAVTGLPLSYNNAPPDNFGIAVAAIFFAIVCFALILALAIYCIVKMWKNKHPQQNSLKKKSCENCEVEEENKSNEKLQQKDEAEAAEGLKVTELNTEAK